MPTPLAGFRVLDLGSTLMAPYAAQWLGDFGADVIKIEPPAGDITRHIGPMAEPQMGSIFIGANRNKRSVVLDLKDPAGREALMRLSSTADILLHNNRPQKMKALGLGPEALLAHNPRLIYACLHGFGEGGPYGGRPAYDDIIQGMCGLADLAGQRSGTPAYLPTAAGDKIAGMAAAIAVLAALADRERSGNGAYVEVPMFETLVAFTAVEHLYGYHFDPPKGPAAYPRVMVSSRRPFATADGYICVMPYTDRHWSALFTEAGRPDLTADTRFQEIEARSQNIGALYDHLSDILKERTTTAWMEVFERIEVPNGPVLSLSELLDDPHLAAVGMTPPIGPGEGVRLLGVPIRFNGERPPTKPPPTLGAHTAEVLASLAPSYEGPTTRECKTSLNGGDPQIDALKPF